MNLPPKVTERAFSRLSEIKASEQGQALRVAVEGGGCSGFQYEIKLDTAQDDDLVLYVVLCCVVLCCAVL